MKNKIYFLFFVLILNTLYARAEKSKQIILSRPAQACMLSMSDLKVEYRSLADFDRGVIYAGQPAIKLDYYIGEYPRKEGLISEVNLTLGPHKDVRKRTFEDGMESLDLENALIYRRSVVEIFYKSTDIKKAEFAKKIIALVKPCVGITGGAPLPPELRNPFAQP